MKIIAYNGTDLSRFDAREETYRAETKEELNIHNSADIIGMIVEQDGFKGHKDLVKVFSNLFHKYAELSRYSG